MLLCFRGALLQCMKLTLQFILYQKPEQMSTDPSVISESSSSLKAEKAS